MDPIVLLLLIAIVAVAGLLIARQFMAAKTAGTTGTDVAAGGLEEPAETDAARQRTQLRQQRGLRRRGPAAAAGTTTTAGGTDDTDEEAETAEDESEAGRKLGAKKARSLAEKAARKQANEARLRAQQEQQERRKLQEEEEARQRQREKELEAQAAAEEEKRKAEERAKEQAEYESIKSMFVLEEAGAQADEVEQESQGMLAEFIEYIQQRKVVPYEDLATHFGLKTQEAINRVQALEKMGRITGVEDDRGKFIFIAQEELENVARFIRQRGRVSIEELAEASSDLVQLQTREDTRLAAETAVAETAVNA